MSRIAKAQKKVAKRGLIVVAQWLGGFVVCPPGCRAAVEAVTAEIATASAWDVEASNKLLAAGGFFLAASAIGVK